MLAGRAGHRVVAVPRPDFFRMNADLDRVIAVLDADLGLLLSYQEIYDGQQLVITELTDLRLDPPGAADPGQFLPPPGLPVAEEKPLFPGNYAIPGVAGQAARMVAGPAAAVLGLAARHAPMKSPGPARTDEPIPDPGQADPDRLAPVGADLVNLLNRTGRRPPACTGVLHGWTDEAVTMRMLAATRAKLPPLIDGIAGPDQLWDALSNRTQGTTHRITRLTVAMPGRYRIDHLAGARPHEPATIACDGERLWKVYPNRVAAGPAKPLGAEFARLIDQVGLLSGWQLSAAGEVEVDGRPGFLVVAESDASADPDPPRTGGLAGALGGHIEVVIDAELGIVLRETAYFEDRPARLFELTEVSAEVDPAAFRIEIAAGTRTVGAGLLSDLDLPGPVKAAKIAVGLGTAGVIAGAAALTGWLQKRPAEQKRPSGG